VNNARHWMNTTRRGMLSLVVSGVGLVVVSLLVAGFDAGDWVAATLGVAIGVGWVALGIAAMQVDAWWIESDKDGIHGQTLNKRPFTIPFRDIEKVTVTAPNGLNGGMVVIRIKSRRLSVVVSDWSSRRFADWVIELVWELQQHRVAVSGRGLRRISDRLDAFSTAVPATNGIEPTNRW
jgi:hypothetical protein